MIAIVNCGLGNYGSIKNMLARIGANSVLSSNHEIIKNASKIILAGVGSFDPAITAYEDAGLMDLLSEIVLVKRTPILGICLGMQVMTEGSQEGRKKGFGWIKGESLKFKFSEGSFFKTPHMGWNTAVPIKPGILFDNPTKDDRFYFAHSYFVKCADSSDVLAKSEYGGVRFHSAISRGNIYGVQFHPEKSHKYGMQLLRQFVLNI